MAGSAQSFDGVGNLIRSHDDQALSWNQAAGRLESATVPTNPVRGIAGTHSYGYDAIGRRAWKHAGNATTAFIYSGPNCIAEYTSGSSANSPGNEYVYSTDIDSLAMVVNNDQSIPKRLSVIRNQQWSMIALIDIDAPPTDRIKELYGYSVFGERTVLDGSGTNLNGASAFKNNYGYTSRRHDTETGLMYFRARYYDPTTGEFVSQDPLEYVDGLSLYRGYFAPARVDPFGLTWVRTGTVDSQGRPVFQVNDGRCAVEILDSNGKHIMSKLVPCPPDRPIDPKKDVKTFNCAGLAFRDYDYKSKADTLKKLAGCKKGVLGKPCPKGFSLKCIFYDITGIKIFKDSKVIQRSKIDDFHIVCMEGSGDRCCSKNGQSPIEGPGPIDSFPPDQPFPPPKLPPGVTLKPVFTQSVYCCKP